VGYWQSVPNHIGVEHRLLNSTHLPPSRSDSKGLTIAVVMATLMVAAVVQRRTVRSGALPMGQFRRYQRSAAVHGKSSHHTTCHCALATAPTNGSASGLHSVDNTLWKGPSMEQQRRNRSSRRLML
jgi:hypothetical protein